MKPKRNRVVNSITHLRDRCRLDRVRDVDSIRFLTTRDVRDTNGDRCHTTRNSVFRGSTGHRVDKSLPGRHLPTRPACRHFRRHRPAGKCRTRARSRAVGPGNGKGRQHLRRPHFPTMRNIVRFMSRVKSIFPGSGFPSAPPSSCPDLFRASTSCGIAVRAGSGRGGGGTWMPGTSPGMTEEVSRRGPPASSSNLYRPPW